MNPRPSAHHIQNPISSDFARASVSSSGVGSSHNRATPPQIDRPAIFRSGTSHVRLREEPQLMLTSSQGQTKIYQRRPSAASLRSMRDDAIDDVSDGETTDEPDGVQTRESLSCRDCKATGFPNLSKLKLVTIAADKQDSAHRYFSKDRKSVV